MDGTQQRRGIGWAIRVVAEGLVLLVTLVLVLLGTLIFFDVADGDVFNQPPRKVYSGTQWALKSIERAAEEYRRDTGRWPLDDGQSTFLYKLMGGGKHPPYLEYRMGGVYSTCEVYNMTSPTHSPWAASVRGVVGPNPPFVLPDSGIKWPEVYGCEETPYGGWASTTPTAWNEVPQDPAICPWLATDVVGYDSFGGRYRAKVGFFGYTVYSDGRNLRDNGGHWDDVHSGMPTLGMIAAYHTADSLFFLIVLAAVLFAWYRFVFLPIWRSLFVAREDRQVEGARPFWRPAVMVPIAVASLLLTVACLCIGLLFWACISLQASGLAKERAGAVRPYLKAAEMGDVAAQLKLGEMYHIGDWVLRDRTEAAKWYRKAADEGNAEAQAKMGSMYYVGDGVPEDKVEAARWFRRAAEQGDADSMNGLAFALATVPELLDAKEAVVWATKAATTRPDDWAILDTLSCAYAQNGDFDAAVKSEQRAIEVAQNPSCKQYSNEMIAVFQKKMTYIEYHKNNGE